MDRLVATFREESPSHLSALHEAAERGEPRVFWQAAHALNGTCKAVGVGRMGSLCLELQRLGDSGDLAGASRLLSDLSEEFDRVKALLDVELSKDGDAAAGCG